MKEEGCSFNDLLYYLAIENIMPQKIVTTEFLLTNQHPNNYFFINFVMTLGVKGL